MIQDLHSHTYYSFCGKDKPEAIVEAAIAGGIEVFGISDHNYGVGYGRLDMLTAPDSGRFHNTYERTLMRYFDHIDLIRQKYRDRIEVKRGIEICTLHDGTSFRAHSLPDDTDISFFDYCLIENLDSSISVTGGDIFAYAKRCGTPVVGIAHTDLFGHIRALGEDPYAYFSRMAEQNIFWEMNVSYDSIHNYRVHGYMLDFFADEAKQEIVRKSGARVSIGFDGHRVEDYLPERVKEYNDKLTALGILKPFE
ncbi:MAG: PHP domain-containing protein [Clostridia bacterium]|nr:PHP domain-containing protein [Clostridia bacterium]MBP5730306.1 PHP domain-containing protein [Clostridia bacterium]